jgi:hypothetical protein
MPLTVQTIGKTLSLPEIRDAVDQTEALNFDLVSLSAGIAGTAQVNLAVFSFRTGSKPPAVVLLEIDGSLLLDRQEAALNAEGKQLICYGTVYVAGSPKNIALFRG